MSWTISTKQYIPVTIGEAWGGGFFAGYISHTADGNPTHALIVAPRATGASGTGYPLTTMYSWSTQDNTNHPGTSSSFDGFANTQAMIAIGISIFPAANFCVNLNISGYTDWYLPAPYELEIAYFNLKPQSTNNNVSSNLGVNPYSVPRRVGFGYIASYPEQTSNILFNTSTERFEPVTHHASRRSPDDPGSRATQINFDTGQYTTINGFKSSSFRTRAFRRIPLTGYTT